MIRCLVIFFILGFFNQATWSTGLDSDSSSENLLTTNEIKTQKIIYCRVTYKDSVIISIGKTWVSALYTDENEHQINFKTKNINPETIYQIYGLELNRVNRSNIPPASITLQLDKELTYGTLVLDSYYHELYDCEVI